MKYFDKEDSNLKKAAIFEEFPFLSDYANLNQLHFVRIKRVGEDLLGTTKLWGSVFLLDGSGRKITKVRTWSILRKRESILDTLNRMGNRVDEVQFILSIYSFTCDPELPGRKALKLYKVPKDNKLRDLVAELVSQAKKSQII